VLPPPESVTRLTSVIDSGLLPTELQGLVVYRAKALRDIGQSADSRRGYQQVVDGAGRLAQAARLAGDFPTTVFWEYVDEGER
jgi:hypothetical protein